KRIGAIDDDKAARIQEGQRLQLIVNLGPDRLLAIAAGHAEAVVLWPEHQCLQHRQHATLEEVLVAVENIDRSRLRLGRALEERKAIHESIVTESAWNRAGRIRGDRHADK